MRAIWCLRLAKNGTSFSSHPTSLPRFALSESHLQHHETCGLGSVRTGLTLGNDVTEEEDEARVEISGACEGEANFIIEAFETERAAKTKKAGELFKAGVKVMTGLRNAGEARHIQG
jgi:hypothetical protein